MTKLKKDLFSGIFFMMFAIFLFVSSFSIKMTTSDSLGPQFFPQIVGIFMGMLSSIQIVECLIKKKRLGSNEAAENQRSKYLFNKGLWMTIALLSGYVLFIEKIGFVLISIIYLFCQINILLPQAAYKNKKKLIKTATVAIIIPIAIYMLFYKVFNIFLPAGLLM